MPSWPLHSHSLSLLQHTFTLQFVGLLLWSDAPEVMDHCHSPRHRAQPWLWRVVLFLVGLLAIWLLLSSNSPGQLVLSYLSVPLTEPVCSKKNVWKEPVQCGCLVNNLLAGWMNKWIYSASQEDHWKEKSMWTYTRFGVYSIPLPSPTSHFFFTC